MDGQFDAAALRDLAADQWGLFTTSQARAVGATYNRLGRLEASGEVLRVRHGVYRLGGAPSLADEELRAAWLATDPSRPAWQRLQDRPPTVVSHRSAANLHRLGTIDADRAEFTSVQRKQTRLDEVRFHRRHLDANQWTVLGGLPITTVSTTIADLAGAGLDGGHLAEVVRDAITQHGLHPSAAATILEPFARRYGAPGGPALVDQFLVQAGIPAELAQAAWIAQQRQETIDAVRSALRPAVDKAFASLAAEPGVDVTALRTLTVDQLAPELAAALSSTLAAALAAEEEGPLARTLAGESRFGNVTRILRSVGDAGRTAEPPETAPKTPSRRAAKADGR